MRKLVLDLDDILAGADGEDGARRCGCLAARIGEYRRMGFTVVLTISADGAGLQGGDAKAAAAPALLRRLGELGIGYDEIAPTRLPAGPAALVLDDKAVTPEEFLTDTHARIRGLIGVDPGEAGR